MLILVTITAIELLSCCNAFVCKKCWPILRLLSLFSVRPDSVPLNSVDSIKSTTMETTDRTVSTVASSSKKFAFSVEEAQHSFKTTDKNITVVCTEGKHDRGSSKIKLVNVVNFKWEQKNYPGRLIACHKDCFLLAYSIRVTKQSKSESMVRVAHLDLPERGLIKGLSDEILDLQFSHNSTYECLLGIIDRTTLHVHKVLVKGDKVSTALKVKIVDPLDGHVPVCDRITWCPYLNDGTDYNDDFAKELLVWTRGSTFQCYSISALSKSYIDTTDLKASDIEEGGFKANDGDAIITGSVFSDDGTTLALSSSDGLIRFYQVYQHANDRSPRRLHLWKPHDGKPVTSFFFLDNYTETVNNKTIWKHAITCAENNSEIKVWCCESWECLQTIRLTSPLPDATLNFKAEIDISSTYMVLTERTTRQIYVLQIRKGKSTASPAIESKKTILTKESTARSTVQPYIVSIAEYPLSASVLGFAILYASSGNSKYGDYDDDDDEDQSSPQCVVIRMFLVQPNNLQDCTLMYEAIPETDDDLLSNDLGEEADRDVDATESHENSSSVTSSASSETTDNNVSHPASEEDDELAAKRKAAKGAALDVKNGDEIHDDGTDNPDVGEDGAKPLADKMAEAAQKLNDVFVAICTGKTPTEGTSAPTTPASSSTKVNLMTPDSFSTPVSSSVSRSEKMKNDESVKPEVLNTLFMLAKATQQHQQPPPEPSASGTEPSGELGLAFANMMKSLSEQSEENANGKSKHRSSTNNGPAGMAQESVLDAPAVPPMPSAEMLASGGSSPSREVQQIMSTKAVISMVEDLFMYSCVERKDDYEDDEDDDEEEGVVNVADTYDEEDGVVVVANGTDDNPDDEVDEKDPVPEATDASVLLSEEKATVAVSALKESIPMEGSNSSSSSNTLTLEEAKRKETTLGSSPTEGGKARVESNDWPSKVPIDVPDPLTTTVRVVDASKEIGELSSKMDRMMELLLVQSQQIVDLNLQLEALKKSKAEEQRRCSTAQNRLGQTLPKAIETRLSTLLIQHTMKVEQTLMACFNNQQARLAETLTHLPQAMVAQLPGRLTPVLLQEMQKKLLPSITGKLDLVQRAVGAELVEKLQANEGAMRDIIQRTLRSEPVTKTLAAAIHTGMRPVLIEVYNQSLTSVILPTYSEHSKELFRQLSNTFKEGIITVMKRVDHHVDRVEKIQELTYGMINVFGELPEKLGIVADDSIKHTVRLISERVEGELRTLETKLLKSLRDNIGVEIEKGFQAQTSTLEDSVLSVVRSQAQTPAPSSMDVQDQIKQHLNSGQINKAFHKALLSNDLSLVEFVLERADHKQVFNPCPLEQTVLLSLIQQISADMDNHNELKHKYLSDAIVSLDPLDPVTKEHSPKVMLELINNCQKFMSANPSNPLCTSLKMLVIAAQYMGFKNI